MIAKFSEFRQFVAQVLAMAHAVPYYGQVPEKNLEKVREMAAAL